MTVMMSLILETNGNELISISIIYILYDIHRTNFNVAHVYYVQNHMYTRIQSFE